MRFRPAAMVFGCLWALAACGSDDSSDDGGGSAGSSGSDQGGSAAQGSGGSCSAKCGLGGTAVVDKGTLRFAQTKECECFDSPGLPPGEACTQALDCQLLCCACACTARGYSAAACVEEKCGDAEMACALALSEVMPVEGTALCE